MDACEGRRWGLLSEHQPLPCLPLRSQGRRGTCWLIAISPEVSRSGFVLGLNRTPGQCLGGDDISGKDSTMCAGFRGSLNINGMGAKCEKGQPRPNGTRNVAKDSDA